MRRSDKSFDRSMWANGWICEHVNVWMCECVSVWTCVRMQFTDHVDHWIRSLNIRKEWTCTAHYVTSDRTTIGSDWISSMCEQTLVCGASECCRPVIVWGYTSGIETVFDRDESLQSHTTYHKNTHDSRHHTHQRLRDLISRYVRRIIACDRRNVCARACVRRYMAVCVHGRMRSDRSNNDEIDRSRAY